MSNTNKFLAIIASALLSISSFAASGSVGKVLLDGLGMESREVLTKIGLKTGAQSELMRSLEVAITGINKGAKPTSEEALKKLFSKNEPILAILAKDFDTISAKELATLNNTLADQANRLKMGAAYIACTTCVDPELAKIGISILAREASESTGKILSQAPSGVALQKEIIAKARSLKISGLTPNALAKLSNSEKAQLFVALKKTSGGTKSERALGRAVKTFSSSSGDDYLQPKLWVLLTEDLADQDMERMATLLNKISKEEPGSEARRIQNLRQWFESNADTPELKEALENLKSKNCWGIF